MSTPRQYMRTDPKTGRKVKASSPKGRELYRKMQVAKKRAATREKNKKNAKEQYGRFKVKNVAMFKYSKKGNLRPSARAAFGSKAIGKVTCTYDGEKKVLMQRVTGSPYWMPWDTFVKNMKTAA